MSHSTSAASTDLFGAQPIIDRATPGSYGVAPSNYRLPEQTSLGGVHLQVSDLARSVGFYQRVLGLRILSQTTTTAALGVAGSDRPLVSLREKRGVRPAARRGRLGLYHFAILLPTRDALARFVRHTTMIGQPIGAGDHLVSEAIYLHDPDDLGIEVYSDRPRETWNRSGRELLLATDPMDLQALVDAASPAPWTEMPDGTVLGHVHLHVGDIGQASAFYSEVLGFDRITWRYPGALFLGAGGYHHHVGTNVWAGPGARPSTTDDASLLEWTIQLPDEPSVTELEASLTKAAAKATRLPGGSLRTADPWGTVIRIGTRASLEADAS